MPIDISTDFCCKCFVFCSFTKIMSMDLQSEGVCVAVELSYVVLKDVLDEDSGRPVVSEMCLSLFCMLNAFGLL